MCLTGRKSASVPSRSDCGESASMKVKGQKRRYLVRLGSSGITCVIILFKQRQMLVMEFIPGLHKYPLPPATRQGLHLFEVGTTSVCSPAMPSDYANPCRCSIQLAPPFRTEKSEPRKNEWSNKKRQCSGGGETREGSKTSPTPKHNE